MKIIDSIRSTIHYYMDGHDFPHQREGLFFSIDASIDENTHTISGTELTMTLEYNYREILDLIEGSEILFSFMCTCGNPGCSPHNFIISCHDIEYFLIKKLSATSLPEPDYLLKRDIALDFILSLYASAVDYMNENGFHMLSGGSVKKMSLMKKGIEAAMEGNSDFLESIDSEITACAAEENFSEFLEEFLERHGEESEIHDRERIYDIFREVYDILFLSEDEQVVCDDILDEARKRIRKNRVVTIHSEPLIMKIIDFLMERRGFVRADAGFYRDDIKKIIWTSLGKELNGSTVSINIYTNEIIKQFEKEEFSISDITDNLYRIEFFRKIPYDRLSSTISEILEFLVSQGFIASN